MAKRSADELDLAVVAAGTGSPDGCRTGTGTRLAGVVRRSADSSHPRTDSEGPSSCHPHNCSVGTPRRTLVGEDFWRNHINQAGTPRFPFDSRNLGALGREPGEYFASRESASTSEFPVV